MVSMMLLMMFPAALSDSSGISVPPMVSSINTANWRARPLAMITIRRYISCWIV
uniref:Uncharacterized protein n=1 Tax=Arundo donax TaxID=35708 RepID=A0A0A8YKE0_ARUDO